MSRRTRIDSKLSLLTRWPWPFALVAPISAYLLLAAWGIGDPGLEYDEVLFANAALGIQDHSFVAWALPLGPKNVPVMLMPYIGALKAYLYFPLIRLVGVDALAIRLPLVIIGALSLLIYARLAARVVGRKGALAFGLLLAADPSYLYHTRLDWGPVVLMMALKALGSYFFVRWWETKRITFIALSGLFLGLGVFDKVNFVWFLLAAGAALLLVYWRDLIARISFPSFAAFTLSGLLGALPVILYNITFPLVTLREPFETSGGSLAANIARKLQMISETLQGVAVYKFVNFDEIGSLWSSYVPLSPSDVGAGVLSDLASLLTASPFGRGSLLLLALPVAGLYLAFRLARRPSPMARPAVAVTLAAVFILLQLMVTNKATGSHHVMMLYPLPQLLLAMAVVEMARSGARWRITLRKGIPAGIAAASLVAALVLVSNVLVDVGYLRYFAAEGGKGIWSSAIYDLAGNAQQRPDDRLVLMDWGFNTQLLLMSKGSIKKDEVYHWLTEGQSEKDRFDTYLQDPNSLFVFHSPKYTKIAKPREIFAKILDEKGLKEEVVQTFYQKNGEPVYLVTRIAPGPH